MLQSCCWLHMWLAALARPSCPRHSFQIMNAPVTMPAVWKSEFTTVNTISGGALQACNRACGQGGAIRLAVAGQVSQIRILARGSRWHLWQHALHARTPHQSPAMTVKAMPRATMTNTPSPCTLLDTVVPAARVRQMMGLGLYGGAGGRGAGGRGDGECGGGEDMLAGLRRSRG